MVLMFNYETAQNFNSLIIISIIILTKGKPEHAVNCLTKSRNKSNCVTSNFQFLFIYLFIYFLSYTYQHNVLYQAIFIAISY